VGPVDRMRSGEQIGSLQERGGMVAEHLPGLTS
jgi:hypothetical protein